MLFVAEIGLNYNNNLALAFELMRQAKWAGADIAKFQIGWKGNPGEINCWDLEKLDKLFDYAHIIGMELMFSVFNKEALYTIRQYPVKRYKVASRTITEDIELVIEILNEGKETIISLGMVDNQIPKLLPSLDAKYLWCKSMYPTLPRDLYGMPRDFKQEGYAGFSDHTLGIEASLMAISRGASIIERHLTLDKSDNTIRDHTLSSTPQEFKTLVDLGRGIDTYTKLGI